jgi:hypothetical protein
MKALIYDALTGKIDRLIEAPDNIIALQADIGENTLVTNDHIDDSIMYVLNGAVTVKPTQLTSFNKLILTANGTDSITITNAPIGATFTARNTETFETVTGLIDGTDSFLTEILGTYKISIVLWPYSNFEVTVNAI